MIQFVYLGPVRKRSGVLILTGVRLRILAELGAQLGHTGEMCIQTRHIRQARTKIADKVLQRDNIQKENESSKRPLHADHPLERLSSLLRGHVAPAHVWEVKKLFGLHVAVCE